MASSCVVEFRISTLVILTFQLLSSTVGRQMCYTCQYVLNGPGIECVTAPLDWTGGPPRMRCPNKCTILAEFDSATGKPTFFHRGCGTVTKGQKEGCVMSGARVSCFYWCGDGNQDDYCNSMALPTSPILAGDGDQDGKHKRNKGFCPVRRSSTLLFFQALVQILVLVTCRAIFRSP